MTEFSNQSALSALLPKIVSLARRAGEEIMAFYSAPDCEITYKLDSSPVTQADIASHHIILQGLAELTPSWPTLSEESAEIPYEERSTWELFWLVDPLDGTREFLLHNGEFTVNIALMHNQTPILGVVYAPAMDKMYLAARGVGAFQAEGDTTVRIQAQSAHRESIRIVASRSHHSDRELLDPFNSGDVSHELVFMGSSLKFCLVAEGSADVYMRTGPTMEWDTAAGHCIVHEAGGSTTDLDGNPLLYNKPVLRNPGFVSRGKPRIATRSSSELPTQTGVDSEQH